MQLSHKPSDNFTPLINDFYLKAYTSCAESGNVNTQ